MMPWACKTPLGKKEWRGQPAQEYIMTINEMLELQNVLTGSSIDISQIANVFSTVCHLFGDENLTKAYQQRLSNLLTNAERKKVFQRLVLAVIQNLSDNCCIDITHSDRIGTQQDVKKEVYRSSSLLLEQLSKFFGIFCGSSLQGIRELNEKKIISENAAKNLLTTLSITTELRLQCYQKHGRQKEALPTVPKLSLTGKESTPCSSTVAIIRLYQSLLLLKNVVTEILEVTKSQESIEPESLVLSVLKIFDFINVSPITKAMAYLRILQLPEALLCFNRAKNGIVDDVERGKLLLALALSYRMIGKFEKVFECCQEVQTMSSALPGAVRKINLLHASVILMNAYMDLGLYQEAMRIHNEIIDCDYPHQLDFQKIFFLIDFVTLFMKTNQNRKAERILRNIIDKLANPRNHYFQYFSCMNNLAAIHLGEGRLIEAKFF